MKNQIYGKGDTPVFRCKWFFLICVTAAVVLFLSSPGMAFNETKLFGKPFRAQGYINQGVGFGLEDRRDSKEEFQSFKYDVLLETLYEPHSDFRIFVSGLLSGDWAYDILSGDNEWEEKGFSDSRDELAHDTVLRDLLQECHITWTPGNFLFRLGKQVVVWGEMDGFRLMDQINPLDQRRGITDVEFESTILPIWLARAEYWLQPDSSWLTDLGFEFIFNPNADWVPNRGLDPGPEVFGIWQGNATIPNPFMLPPPVPPVAPFDYAYVGAFSDNLFYDEPNDWDEWDSDYFEYGFRVKAIVSDTILTLNYFYGKDNDYVAIFNPLTPLGPVPALPPALNPYDGRLVLNLARERKYARFRIAGFTLTRDFENLYIKSLGGVAPVLRLEALYGFGNTFEKTTRPGYVQYEFTQRDEIRYAIGIDWKVKLNWLNSRSYIWVFPQFYHRHIPNYPDDYDLTQLGGAVHVYENNYTTTLLLKTLYFHEKLDVSFFWLDDRTMHGGFYRPQLTYIYSDALDITLGAIFINATKKTNPGIHAMENKDHVYFTISYKF